MSVEWALICCLTRRGNAMWRQRCSGESHEWSQREWLEWCSCKARKVKLCWLPPEARGRKGRILPRVSDGAWPCQHLDFRRLSSRATGGHNFDCGFFVWLLFSFLAAPSPSCGTWDLHCITRHLSLRNTDSRVVGHQLGCYGCGLSYVHVWI